jgi:hypothetical protein
MTGPKITMHQPEKSKAVLKLEKKYGILIKQKGRYTFKIYFPVTFNGCYPVLWDEMQLRQVKQFCKIWIRPKY